MHMENSTDIKRIEFEVFGEPKSQLRSHLRAHGNKIHAYTPEQTKLAEHSFLMQCLAHRPKELIYGPVMLGLKMFRSIPKAIMKSDTNRQLAIDGMLQPTTKPDLSNYTKLAEDVMTGLFYRDDAQIVGYLPGMGKYYSMTPRIEVTIEYTE